ncbi:MAG: hypothetical protein Q8N99_01060 [Nanoarchaeota archaeon]|nr:hypothetical protein [Nanoarchaeota archaeon]
MQELSREDFEKYWGGTEVIREYQGNLFTFGDTNLHYVYLSEHPIGNRIIVKKGIVLFKKPIIILPGQCSRFEFNQGFQNRLSPDAAQLFRASEFPFSNLTNKTQEEETIEYGSLNRVLKKIDTEIQNSGDLETGIIKGVLGGLEVSLVRYSFGLAVKSGPSNVEEYIEHLKKQRGKPIRPGESVTDEDLKMLFG